MVTENQSAGHSSAVPSTAAHVPASRSRPVNTFVARSERVVVKSRDELLPFVVTSHTKRGRFVGTDSFDPEIIGDRGGYLAGLEAMGLLLTYLDNDTCPQRSLVARDVLIEAGKKASLFGSQSGRAGFAFVCAAGELLHAVALLTDWRSVLASQIAQAKGNLQFHADTTARQKSEFVSRMRAAKAAKKGSTAPSTVQTSEGAQQ